MEFSKFYHIGCDLENSKKQWENVIFNDETTINLFVKDEKQFV